MVSLNSHFFHVSPRTAMLRHVKDKHSLMNRHSLESGANIMAHKALAYRGIPS